MTRRHELPFCKLRCISCRLSHIAICTGRARPRTQHAKRWGGGSGQARGSPSHSPFGAVLVAVLFFLLIAPSAAF